MPTRRVKPIPLGDIRDLPYTLQMWIKEISDLLYSSNGLIPLDSIDWIGALATADQGQKADSALQPIHLTLYTTDEQHILANQIFGNY